MGNVYYYYTYYIINKNNQEVPNIKESGYGAKARIIKLAKVAKALNQTIHIEVVKIKGYMGASYVGKVIKKEVVWSN